MDYEEAVTRLDRLRRLRPKLGTETTAALLAHLGDPHADLTAVQVAGSNGKGSTARVCAQILRETDRRVGLYTSPDLQDLRERVAVDDRTIPPSAVVAFVERAWPFVRDPDAETPTFFEAVTAMALWHFGRSAVDVAVLEVGIGGRYDATSVVDPAAAAVTTVSLEHTAILGDSVAEIARDKASVAPTDRPLVTGATGEALAAIRAETDVVTVGLVGDPPVADDAAPELVADRAVDVRGGGRDGPDPAVLAAEGAMVTPTASTVALSGPDWSVETESPLLGAHQALNAGIAATLARQVAPDVDESAIAAGLRTATWPGRFEIVDRDPITVLDGAHNPAACETLEGVLDRLDYENLVVVFGAMREKDHPAMVRALPDVDRVLVVEPAVERAETVETLTGVFDRESDAAVEAAPSVTAGVERACRVASAADAVLVTGSLYTVAAARGRWRAPPMGLDPPSGA